jgi:uncharacterized membrane protein
MVGLGDLSGGGFNSFAWSASGDGSVLAGQGLSASGYEAFRWTQAGGMVALGDLPGGTFFSEAKIVSRDGTLILGQGSTASADEAFIWDEVHGMRNLRGVLVNDYGLDLTGWNLSTVQGISDDNSTIVGIGTDPSGQTEAWIATIPEPGTWMLVSFGLALGWFLRDLRARGAAGA